MEKEKEIGELLDEMEKAIIAFVQRAKDLPIEKLEGRYYTLTFKPKKK